jgi:hypothetical protein
MIKTDRQHLMKAQSAKCNQHLFRNFGTCFFAEDRKDKHGTDVCYSTLFETHLQVYVMNGVNYRN